MKSSFLFAIIAVWASCQAVYSQNEPTTSTSEAKICISREAAESCAVNTEKAKAQESQIEALEQANRDKDRIINELKIEIARLTGQLTATQQQVVLSQTVIDFLLRNGRKKCGPLNLICLQ